MLFLLQTFVDQSVIWQAGFTGFVVRPLLTFGEAFHSFGDPGLTVSGSRHLGRDHGLNNVPDAIDKCCPDGIDVCVCVVQYYHPTLIVMS